MEWHVGSDWPEWGSAPRKPLVQLDFAHKGELLDSVIGTHPATGKSMVYHVLRCEMCIGIHVWPLSSSEDLAEYYARTFYEESHPDYLARYEDDRLWWETAVHGPLLDVCCRVGCLPHDPTIIEIGAGPGMALDVAQERDWRTYAIEPDPVCAQRLTQRGHLTHHGTLETFSHAHDGEYDVVWLYEVLEHQPNPEEFLLRCYDLLVPGGVLVICVPSDFTSGQFEAMKRFNLSPWFISSPDHQNYFTPVTLKLLLRRCGFQIRYTRMTFPLVEEYMLAQGRCYVKDSFLGHDCHQERMAYELAAIADGRWPALEAEYIANVERRVGREVIMIATKH